MKLQQIAYGTPKHVRQIPVVSDKAGTVAVRLFQVMRARPFVYGLRKGEGKRR